jgi:hypothetical protein
MADAGSKVSGGIGLGFVACAVTALVTSFLAYDAGERAVAKRLAPRFLDIYPDAQAFGRQCAAANRDDILLCDQLCEKSYGMWWEGRECFRHASKASFAPTPEAQP